MEELKLCPFCGGEARYIVNKYKHHLVECKEALCEVEPCTSSFLEKVEAIKAWNTRVEPKENDYVWDN